MFSFVDMRLALLLSAAVLLVRAQGEDDGRFHHCFTELLNSFLCVFPPSSHFFFRLVFESGFSLRGWTAAENLREGEKFTVEI